MTIDSLCKTFRDVDSPPKSEGSTSNEISSGTLPKKLFINLYIIYNITLPL